VQYPKTRTWHKRLHRPSSFQPTVYAMAFWTMVRASVGFQHLPPDSSSPHKVHPEPTSLQVYRRTSRGILRKILSRRHEGYLQQSIDLSTIVLRVLEGPGESSNFGHRLLRAQRTEKSLDRPLVRARLSSQSESRCRTPCSELRPSHNLVSLLPTATNL